MRCLILPPTIKTPEYADVPKEQDILDMIERRRTAKIIEGYTISNNVDEGNLFNVYAEINIDNHKLWSLVKALTINFPEEVAFIYHYIDEEYPKYGKYIDKFELFNYLAKYETEITQDGYFHFGLISHTEVSLQEVFVHRTKYIQYWGMDELKFKEIMVNFDIYEIKDLNFIDEYPVQTMALNTLNPNVTDTLDLFNEFEEKFGNEKFL